MHTLCRLVADMDPQALDPLADHASLTELVFLVVHPPECIANARTAITRLLEKAQQGRRLSVTVPKGVFREEEAAEVTEAAACARHTAGTPGGVPALTVG
jgi:hypothetical protein